MLVDLAQREREDYEPRSFTDAHIAAITQTICDSSG